MLNDRKLDSKVVNNLINTKLLLLIYPTLLLLSIVFVIGRKGFTADTYIQIQKSLFFFLNDKLSSLSDLQFNLTQLGDALIFLSLLSFFIIYAPKLWRVLLTSLLLAGIVSPLLKRIFAIPRPAAVFDNDSFVIIGKILTGSTSLPSGHSIATFTIISVILLAFLPKKNINKVLWCVSVLVIGLIIAFSRVAVGAHYPLDVITGSAIGFICAVTGIIIDNKYNWFAWIRNKKYYPIFILLLSICMLVIVKKLLEDSLMIFYISLISIVVTLYLMIKTYVKK